MIFLNWILESWSSYIIYRGCSRNEVGCDLFKKYIENVTITNGKLTVIHTANKCGFKNNTRLIPSANKYKDRDINEISKNLEMLQEIQIQKRYFNMLMMQILF